MSSVSAVPGATCSIYALVDPRDGEVRYVGKTINAATRYIAHLSEARGGRYPSYKNHWINELVEAGLLPVLTVLQVVPRDAWQAVEQFWIAGYRDAGNRLTNNTAGGDGSTGVSPEVRAKMRASAKARGFTPAMRAGLAKARTRMPDCRGSKSHFAKLTEADVLEIRRLREEGMTVQALADQFGVTIGSINPILYGKTWRECGGTPIVRDNRRVLTEAQIVEIRERHFQGESVAKLAAAFATISTHVSSIVTGKMWAHVGGPIRPSTRRSSLLKNEV